MTGKVLLKKSSVAAKTPLTTDLDYGELAINYADEKLYFKNASNQIKSFSVGGGAASTGLNFISYVATASQTTFAVTYTVPYVTAVINGAVLNPSDYTATSGTDIVLATGCAAGDVVSVYGFESLSVGYGLPTQTGNTGKYLSTDGTNVSWQSVVGGGAASTGLNFISYVATASQTTFAVTYTAPYVTVIVNGAVLNPSDYTATSGTDIVLATGCAAGDVVSLQGFESLSVGYGLPTLTGNTGKYLSTDGTNVSWESVVGGGGASTGLNFISYVATASQTTFAVTYTAPYVTVIVNGAVLNPSDYTATSGTDIVLATGCAAGDIVSLQGFESLSVGYGLPTQTGNTGKYLLTDGSNVSWQSAVGGTIDIQVVSALPASPDANTLYIVV